MITKLGELIVEAAVQPYQNPMGGGYGQQVRQRRMPHMNRGTAGGQYLDPRAQQQMQLRARQAAAAQPQPAPQPQPQPAPSNPQMRQRRINRNYYPTRYSNAAPPPYSPANQPIAPPATPTTTTTTTRTRKSGTKKPVTPTATAQAVAPSVPKLGKTWGYLGKGLAGAGLLGLGTYGAYKLLSDDTPSYGQPTLYY